MKKPLINHTTPRPDTKRAAALQTRAVTIIRQRLLELGAHGLAPRSDYETKLPLLMYVPTDFGTLELSMHPDRGSNLVAVYGRFTDATDAQLDALVAAFGQWSTVSRNGKWNHHQYLNVNGMEEVLGDLTRLIPRFNVDKRARSFSEPAY
jgi:hypothetical protein